MIVIKVLTIYIGLCLYAQYEHCDPVASGLVEKPDQVCYVQIASGLFLARISEWFNFEITLPQILPHYVTEVGGKIPGLPGLFIAGIFAAGLSSLSSSLNTLSGVIYDDFIKPK